MRFLILFFACIAFSLSASEEECCFWGPRPQQIRVRHIEPNGIGYREGYTSLDLFLTVPLKCSNFLPLFDLRGHVFNHGKYALNTGFGFRWLPERFAKVLGVNFFYDHRRTNKRPYNQVSMGWELLGQRWDFRANGYWTVGGKRTDPFDFSFDLFPNNTFLITAEYESSMKGADGEVGFHYPIMECVEVYAAAGLYYYYAGKFGVSTTGGSLRASATIFKYLTLEANGSYDHLFKWIGQGAIAINIPFGPRKPIENCLNERLYQLIQHNEIIVVDTFRHKL